jgi:hypothetical protein
MRRDDGAQVKLKTVDEVYPGDQVTGTMFQQLHVSDKKCWDVYLIYFFFFLLLNLGHPLRIRTEIQ